MHRVIAIHYATLDGFVEDPDGAGGTPGGGWLYRYGPETLAGDKFRLGTILDTGALLFGRVTWEVFSRRWPARSDDFSARMNAARKVVVSRSLGDVSAWENSTLLDGDLVDGVQRLRSERDVVVIGSVGIVHELTARDLVDEFRVVVLPTVLGTGRRLFTGPAGADDLDLASVEQSGSGALLRYRRPGR
ncbi:dihydrofolate reductase family protein [Kineosporia sp. A_224]|uniref:dihydrofolate reductase family protein n=1 Tax=Kineosporia sp. A_224 TaxID=1962180 RepID=UPI0018E915EE|nr:dihydrofolate reductase family protein [Kineosporia sp. A_224]